MNGDGQSTEPKDAKKTENKDRWTKADILSKFTMPLAVVLVTSIFTYCQSQSAAKRLAQEKEEAEDRRTQENKLTKDRIKADRLTAMLKHFVSENPKERELAFRTSEHLVVLDQFPADMYRVFAQLYNTESDPAVKESLKASIKKAVEVPSKNAEQNLAATQALVQIAPETASQLPARIYLHIRRGSERSQAEQLERNLEEKGLNVPGIDLVNQVPNQNELRYFAANSNNEDLKKIQAAFADMGLQFRLVDLSRLYPNSKARPRHYEVWFGLKTAE